MREVIKKILLELLPELSGGLHLDRYARVLSAADAPAEGSVCERFRPRYAVDLEILSPDMEPDPAFPHYSAVPLPVGLGAGMESGSYAFPEPGTLCVIGFAYGRPDHPIIRQLMPMGSSLPAVTPGEVLLQKSPTVLQRADASGNWMRQTDADITDTSLGRKIIAQRSSADIGTESRIIAEHSTESVGSMKTVEAGTVLTLLAGLRADLGTLGDINITAAANSTHSTAGTATETVGKDKYSTIKGNKTVTVHGNSIQTVQGTKSLKAEGKVTIESGQEILLRAPVIKIQGILTTEGYNGGAGESTLHGSFTVLQGGISVPDQDVSAGSVSLRGHTHGNVMPGGGTTGSPVGG